MNFTCKTLITAAVLTAGASAATAADGYRYLAQELGTLGGNQSRALDVNDAGYVVGWCETAQPIAETHAFVYFEGDMKGLDTLGGGYAEARAINNRRQIVGTSKTADGDFHAFYAYDELVWDLNDVTLGIGKVDSIDLTDMTACQATLKVLIEANDINDDGRVIATGLNWADEFLHAYMLVPDSVNDPGEPSFNWVDLGALDGALYCRPYALNGNAVIVGESGGLAFICENDKIRNLDLFAKQSVAYGIADDGVIVGATGETHRACVWREGFRFDLGFGCDTVSEALDVNESGLIVGWASDIDMEEKAALLWEGCIPRNLNEITMLPVRTVLPPWKTLTEAVAIDGEGRIVGSGISQDGGQKAFLLLPIEDEPTD